VVIQTFHIRCTITSSDGRPFSHTFAEDVDCDPETIYTPLEAIENAVMTFRSGLTLSEQEACWHSLDILAHRRAWWNPELVKD
jgi:hypothetical protein